MRASGTLTCPSCGYETPWPHHCECAKEKKPMPQRIRCKFVVEKVTRFTNNSEATLRAVSSKDTPENEAFTKYTPGGTLVVMIDNPPAVAMLKPGKAFYLDLTPAE